MEFKSVELDDDNPNSDILFKKVSAMTKPDSDDEEM